MNITQIDPSPATRDVERKALAHLALLINPHDEQAFVASAGACASLDEEVVVHLVACAQSDGVSLLDACLRAERMSQIDASARGALVRFGRFMLALRLEVQPAADAIALLLHKALNQPGGMVEVLKARLDDARRKQDEGDAQEMVRCLLTTDNLVAAASRYDHSREYPTIVGFLAEIALLDGLIASGEGAS